jgi:hypothetical protein
MKHYKCNRRARLLLLLVKVINYSQFVSLTVPRNTGTAIFLTAEMRNDDIGREAQGAEDEEGDYAHRPPGASAITGTAG